jgi:hypothetical protein
VQWGSAAVIDCKCGKPVRLGANRLTVNRKRGVAHYIAHTDGSPACGGDWTCIALKPYPKVEAEKAYSKLVARWNESNSPTFQSPETTKAREGP